MEDDADSSRMPRWSAERRLALVRARLQWEGRVNRADLVERFGISPNQASADLRRFNDIHPGALVYDPREKTYRAAPGLADASPADSERLLRDLRLVAEGVLPGNETDLAALPALATAGAPARPVAPAVLRAVLAAIRARSTLRGDYRSFSSASPRRRVLEPHALVFDGFRWHTRSRDAEDGAYKDFVLGRLSRVRVGNPATAAPVHDEDWVRFVNLDIRPHPGLSASQRKAIESDYGMIGGRVVIGCRQAVVYYAKRRLGLTPGHERLAAMDQHIILYKESSASE